MEAIQHLGTGLLNFVLYFAISLVFLFIFKIVYTKVTPHDEWKLVKDEKNIAAALGFAGAIIGFCMALSSAASNSVSLIDYAVWGVVALFAQLLAFAVVRFVFMPRIVQRITDNEVSAGIMLGGVSIAVGLLNAACMTY